jgi:hypothetical protein
VSIGGAECRVDLELLDTRPSVKERADAVALGEVYGNLVVEDVAFGYDPRAESA